MNRLIRPLLWRETKIWVQTKEDVVIFPSAPSRYSVIASTRIKIGVYLVVVSEPTWLGILWGKLTGFYK